MSYAHILGTMYEHSSYYDKGFIIDELMLYHIIYDLYHDPYPGHSALVNPSSPSGGMLYEILRCEEFFESAVFFETPPP